MAAPIGKKGSKQAASDFLSDGHWEPLHPSESRNPLQDQVWDVEHLSIHYSSGHVPVWTRVAAACTVAGAACGGGEDGSRIPRTLSCSSTRRLPSLRVQLSTMCGNTSTCAGRLYITIYFRGVSDYNIFNVQSSSNTATLHVIGKRSTNLLTLNPHLWARSCNLLLIIASMSFDSYKLQQ